MKEFLNNIDSQILISRKIALFTFLLSSLIITTYYFTNFHGIIYLSLFFLLIAVPINTFISFVLIFSIFKNKNKIKPILFSLFLILINLPFGLFYMKIGFDIYDAVTYSNGLIN